MRPVLEDFGKWDEVYAILQETMQPYRKQCNLTGNDATLQETMQQGNGAARQREVYKRTSSLEDVVDFIVRETAKGTTVV